MARDGVNNEKLTRESRGTMGGGPHNRRSMSRVATLVLCLLELVLRNKMLQFQILLLSFCLFILFSVFWQSII